MRFVRSYEFAQPNQQVDPRLSQFLDFGRTQRQRTGRRDQKREENFLGQ